MISDSTSAADRPRASVCTCTDGGMNSGRKSTRADPSWATPRISTPTASAMKMRPTRGFAPTTPALIAATPARRPMAAKSRAAWEVLARLRHL